MKLTGDWAHLQEDSAFEAFLDPLERKSWVTYIQTPPTEDSRPEDIVKYLARYLTGGPISDNRLVSIDDGWVRFIDRTGTTHGGSEETEVVELPVVEFVRRWCLQILPRGFTKTRSVGGWNNHHRRRYVAECLGLLQQKPESSHPGTSLSELQAACALAEERVLRVRACPVCGKALERLESVHRNSWREVFSFHSEYRPTWYRPWETSG